MTPEKKLLLNAFIVAASTAAGIALQYPLVTAMKEKTDFTVRDTSPSCPQNVTSVFKYCSFETDKGTFKIGNFSTDLHSQNRKTMFDKLILGQSYEADYINTLFGPVILKITPRP